jgi:predicted flap endonuclease-1-like 5' DNA nuclease
MAKLEKIEGIGAAYVGKLAAVGVSTTQGLLKAGGAPVGRRELAKKTGISEKLILEWVNLADLFRIKGVGEEYSDLLEEAGVDTVKELRNRNPENLYEALKATNAEKKLVRRTPSLLEVKSWVAHAKSLEPMVTY